MAFHVDWYFPEGQATTLSDLAWLNPPGSGFVAIGDHWSDDAWYAPLQFRLDDRPLGALSDDGPLPVPPGLDRTWLWMQIAHLARDLHDLATSQEFAVLGASFLHRQPEGGRQVRFDAIPGGVEIRFADTEARVLLVPHEEFSKGAERFVAEVAQFLHRHAPEVYRWRECAFLFPFNQEWQALAQADASAESTPIEHPAVDTLVSHGRLAVDTLVSHGRLAVGWNEGDLDWKKVARYRRVNPVGSKDDQQQSPKWEVFRGPLTWRLEDELFTFREPIDAHLDYLAVRRRRLGRLPAEPGEGYLQRYPGWALLDLALQFTRFLFPYWFGDPERPDEPPSNWADYDHRISFTYRGVEGRRPALRPSLFDDLLAVVSEDDLRVFGFRFVTEFVQQVKSNAPFALEWNTLRPLALFMRDEV